MVMINPENNYWWLVLMTILSSDRAIVMEMMSHLPGWSWPGQHREIACQIKT